MPQKRYIVRLTAQEREVCQQTLRKLNGGSERVRRAQILLKADADGPAWTDERIADAFSCRTKTVENIRLRCVLQGFEQALERKRREFPPVPKLLNGEQEAHIIALRLGPPPKGYANWSLRLLARRVVELAVVESISHETIRRTLKKWDDPAEDRVLGDPAAGRCRVRGAHGTGLGSVSETLRSGLSRRVHGRAAGAVGPGNPPADGGHEEPSPACRLRVRTGRHGRGLPVQRAAGGLAAGDGPGPACEGGLGAGGRRPVGRTLRRLPEDHLGVRPPQHAHQGSLLRSVRAGPGTGVGSSHRVLPHAETRELAEHRGRTN